MKKKYKKWGNEVECERLNRILISIYAYAYEIEGDPIVDDDTFDDLAASIDETMSTGNKKIDKFFREEFDMFTGMWIHNHPELDKIAHIYDCFYGL